MATVAEKVEFSFEDLQALKEPYVLNLHDLEEICAYEPKDGSPYRLVTCKPKYRDKGPCPWCKAENASIRNGKTDKPRYVHDVNAGVYQIDLSIETPRYKCKQCGGTYDHRFESIQANKQMTDRLLEQIQRDCFVRPFTDIANDIGVSVEKVEEIFDEYVSQLERDPPICPRVLGIDEVHIAHAMRGVFVDSENGNLLEMTSNNSKEQIISTIKSFEGWDKNLEVVTIDMSCGYRAWLRDEFPNVAIVIDHFHVAMNLNNCCKSCRPLVTEIVNEHIAKEPDSDKKEYHKDLMRQLQKNPYLFKYNEKHLSDKNSRLQLMADVCNEFPEFNHLRLLKENFELIYGCTDKASAERAFETWMRLVPPAGKEQKKKWEEDFKYSAEPFEVFRSFKNTVEQYYDEIFQYFEPGCRVTNAVAEGRNNMIDRINRQGNGYSFDRLRAKALFRHLVSPPVRYHLKTTKRKQTEHQDTSIFETGKVGYYGVPQTTTVEVVELVPERRLGIPVRQPLSVLMFLPKTN